jgi:hypothetical protein
MPPRAPRFPVYEWDARSGRYRGEGGRYVSRTAARQALDDALLSRQRDIRSLADELRAGAITTDEWLAAMRENIKAVHLYSGAAAKGGWAELDNADFGRIGREIRDQYAYATRFAEQIADGTQPLDGRFGQRVELYAQSGRATYHAVERERERDAGKSEARSVLHPADHCGECIEQADLGWQPLDDFVPIGARQCLSRCHCSAEYR